MPIYRFDHRCCCETSEVESELAETDTAGLSIQARSRVVPDKRGYRRCGIPQNYMSGNATNRPLTLATQSTNAAYVLPEYENKER